MPLAAPTDLDALAVEFGTWLRRSIHALRDAHPRYADELSRFAERAHDLYVRRVPPAPTGRAPKEAPVTPYRLLEAVERIACEAGDFSKFADHYGDSSADADLVGAGSAMSAFVSAVFAAPAARAGAPMPPIAWCEDHWIRLRRPDYASRFPIGPLFEEELGS